MLRNNNVESVTSITANDESLSQLVISRMIEYRVHTYVQYRFIDISIGDLMIAHKHVIMFNNYSSTYMSRSIDNINKVCEIDLHAVNVSVSSHTNKEHPLYKIIHKNSIGGAM